MTENVISTILCLSNHMHNHIINHVLDFMARPISVEIKFKGNDIHFEWFRSLIGGLAVEFHIGANPEIYP